MKHKRWFLPWLCLLQAIAAEEPAQPAFNHSTISNETPRGVFSPRMDYEQWKPLGRGDPLKNDPTYDYVPPVLDRVHYWMDPALRKPDPTQPGDAQKTEILLLGVSSKKASTAPAADARNDPYDSFLQFVDAPKFATRLSRPHYPYFQGYAKAKKGVEQRMPYTMLMPPPLATKSPDPPSTTPTPAATSTTPRVTVQAAQLVYSSESTESAVYPESYIQIQFASATNSDRNINYVTPPPLSDEVMRKGQVSDDKLDISNTYVKIGKPEAQMHSAEMLVRKHPSTTATPTLKRSTHPLLKALEKEKSTTAASTDATTTLASLTTDPLFKHYKQPAEPLKGPLYLIIQGHSKVKTYGPGKQYHGIRLHETNEIGGGDETAPPVRHLHGFGGGKKEADEVGGRGRRARSGNLQTLKHVIESGLGALDFGEAEVAFGYQVRDDVTSEKYHKGIVEAARKLHHIEA